MADFKGVFFAQITDCHVGGIGINPVEARANLTWAIEEISALATWPSCIIATGDVIHGGTAAELREYAEQIAQSRVPVYSSPANHDLWGEEDTSAWQETIGPLRQSVDLDGLRIVLWDDSQYHPEQDVWDAGATREQLEWLDAELSVPQPCVVAHHIPILPIGDDFHDKWRGSNAPEVLELMRRHRVLAAITGHWHRNGEWDAGGTRVINTGSLAGWQWTGTFPHCTFPTRPGYRLFHYDGTLHTLWREGSYWQTPAPTPQVTLEWIGPAHTGGPRPQVRPVEVAGPCNMRATAYSMAGRVESVEWSVASRQWHKMTMVYDGLWSEWEAALEPEMLRTGGEAICCVRCRDAEGRLAYDEVPIRFEQRDPTAAGGAPAHASGEMLFELFTSPR